MKFYRYTPTVGDKVLRARQGRSGDWTHFRVSFLDRDGTTHRDGVKGSEWWVRPGQIVAVSDRRAQRIIAALATVDGGLFTEVPGNPSPNPDKDLETVFDAHRKPPRVVTPNR